MTSVHTVNAQKLFVPAGGEGQTKNATTVGVIKDLVSYDIRALFEKEMLKETKE